jgi:hypothetical protein
VRKGIINKNYKTNTWDGSGNAPGNTAVTSPAIRLLAQAGRQVSLESSSIDLRRPYATRHADANCHAHTTRFSFSSGTHGVPAASVSAASLLFYCLGRDCRFSRPLLVRTTIVNEGKQADGVPAEANWGFAFALRLSRKKSCFPTRLIVIATS